jgi:FemAB-related protein (PEP-CTERM system-associated)
MTTTIADGSKFGWLLPSPPDRAARPHVFGAAPTERCPVVDRTAAREIHVAPLNSAGAAAWDRFVESAPNATFFHRAGWKEVIQRSFGHDCYFLQARCEGRTTGVLPLVHLRSRLFGNALISNAYGVYGGPVASDEASLGALNDAAVSLAARLGVDYLEYRLRSPSFLPWRRNSELYATFRKPLAPDPETTLNGVPRKRRAMLRKAKALDLQSEVDSDIRRFYRVYSRRVRDLGTPVYPARYFRTLLEVFDSDCEVLTVVRSNKPLSSVIAFHWRDEVQPYYGGGVEEARQCAANDFMYWELMRRACDKGARVFDFGRSKVGTGTFAYKSIWGFEPEPLHHEYLLLRADEMPNINPLNPKYAVLIALWRRLPLCVANALGPRISRGLG